MKILDSKNRYFDQYLDEVLSKRRKLIQNNTISVKKIIDDVKKNGGQAILTKKQHKTGTDRIYEALQNLDTTNIDLVMNLQGDEPLMNIEDIRDLNNQMIKNQSQLGTLASEIRDEATYKNENIVKAMTKEKLDGFNFPEVISFMRKVSKDNKNIYHHLGIYCYQKDTLKDFVSF